MHLKHRARRVGRLEIARQKRRPDARADRHRGVGFVFQINHRVVAEIVDVLRLFHARQFQVGSGRRCASEIVAVGPRAIRIDLWPEITCQCPVAIRADDCRAHPKKRAHARILGFSQYPAIGPKRKKNDVAFFHDHLGQIKRDGLLGSCVRINRLAFKLAIGQSAEDIAAIVADDEVAGAGVEARPDAPGHAHGHVRRRRPLDEGVIGVGAASAPLRSMAAKVARLENLLIHGSAENDGELVMAHGQHLAHILPFGVRRLQEDIFAFHDRVGDAAGNGGMLPAS